MPIRLILVMALGAFLTHYGSVNAQSVSFQNEVMAILSRAGCNSGACHGNLNGKGGFKLSLRGESPAFDHNAISRGALGRRLDLHRPADSLLLLKASGAVPHEGGKRFGSETSEYHLLHRWIATGARMDLDATLAPTQLSVTPAERTAEGGITTIPLRVVASWGEGRSRDVTNLACFELSNTLTRITADGVAHREGFGETAVLVRYLHLHATASLAWVPPRPGFVWRAPPEANFIDQHIHAKLRTLKLQPSGPALDAVFLRRVYLDTLGLLPTAEEARAFLADTRADRRERLIDQLLTRPEFADFWALKWSDLLRSEEKVLDRKGVQALHSWLRQGFLDGKGLDALARDLLTGRGSTYENPAANFYRALRDPPARAEAAAQVFLGVRVQCARCHNHPFDRWTQDDYYGLAAFFPRVQYRIVDNRRRDRLDTHEFDGEQIVWMAREGEVKDPRSGNSVTPRFLGSSSQVDPEADRLAALAAWVTQPDNPYFARTQANRVWFHLLGRGLVDPNDDFRASNPPSNAPLLDALARHLVNSKFDLRSLVRIILSSRTYQLSSVPNETNVDDENNFSHALLRRLTAEQLLDATSQVAGVPVRFNGYPEGVRAGQLAGIRAFRVQDQRPSDGERFLQVFGKPERSLTCECERSEDATLAQAFQLTSGELTQRLLSETNNRLGQLLSAGRSDLEVIEELFLAALSRRPTAREYAIATDALKKGTNRRAAFEDLLWGLLNSKEFLLRL